MISAKVEPSSIIYFYSEIDDHDLISLFGHDIIYTDLRDVRRI